VTYLRRTKIENFSVEEANILEDFPEVKPFPIEKLFSNIPSLDLSDHYVRRLDQ